MRPQAGGSAIIAIQKSDPRPGQAEQPQGVPSRCRVEDDVVEALGIAGQEVGELIKGGDFRGAGSGQLLAHGRAFGVAGTDAHLRQDTLPIRLGGRVGSMFRTDRPGAPGTGVGVLRSSIPSISSRFDAASVLTSRTFLPASAKVSAAAVDSEVFPTPPLPVKNRCRVGWFRNPRGPGLSQVCTSSCEGMPPLCTTLPSITTAGVALTPERLISSGFSTL